MQMSEQKLTVEPVSPCIKVCQLDHASGLCVGCKRTMTEIAQWAYYDAEQKLKILRDLSNR